MVANVGLDSGRSREVLSKGSAGPFFYMWLPSWTPITAQPQYTVVILLRGQTEKKTEVTVTVAALRDPDNESTRRNDK